MISQDNKIFGQNAIIFLNKIFWYIYIGCFLLSIWLSFKAYELFFNKPTIYNNGIRMINISTLIIISLIILFTMTLCMKLSKFNFLKYFIFYIKGLLISLLTIVSLLFYFAVVFDQQVPVIVILFYGSILILLDLKRINERKNPELQFGKLIGYISGMVINSLILYDKINFS
jgi:hypothetical protein